MDKIRNYILHSDTLAPIFWKIWFWWGIRQARKRRIAWEEKQKTMPQLDTEQYWEKVHNDRNRDL